MVRASWFQSDFIYTKSVYWLDATRASLIFRCSGNSSSYRHTDDGFHLSSGLLNQCGPFHQDSEIDNSLGSDLLRLNQQGCHLLQHDANFTYL